MMKYSRILSASEQKRLRAHLKRGGLIAYPTESCYGIGCLPQRSTALKKLIRVKKRPQNKGMIVIGSSVSQLLPLLERPSEKVIAMLECEWPAPTTFLLPCRNQPILLRGKGREKLAVRVPAHHSARQLCAMLSTPLVSTSCNRSGGRPCKSEREVRRQFGRKVWVVGGRTGDLKSPSHIIDAETGKRLR
ncbi:L-threonylcarbamoyladenylate synthase [Neisseria zoodegmatis]|uniref:Threonylcarbamoyl-AMP synthase n=1 Tax=Neisseria zoodegmatis TaxID=326523 RepID=A0AB38DNQ0_9NEIS|nr:L-threonylcarbamoyladenylate synthase [Neisseria zoodegmatis]OSI08490.1 tRNA threonylcarbamoyladenosine biosynthesis protein RimN [Neisseria zoodegmatis]SNU78800.1 putative translation factor [Neisseria zoodegmatis]